MSLEVWGLLQVVRVKEDCWRLVMKYPKEKKEKKNKRGGFKRNPKQMLKAHQRR